MIAKRIDKSIALPLSGFLLREHMWLLLRPGVQPQGVLAWLEAQGLGAQLRSLGERWIIEVEVSDGQAEALLRLEEVEKVFVSERAMPLVSSWQGGIRLGTWQRGEELLWIAGPCSVENRQSLLQLAEALKALGVQALRGGAFKARTSPYSFQGLGAQALDWLREARALTGLPICVEILSETHLPLYADVDLIQIGARNMDNYWLLRAVGELGRPVLLKRNPQATVEEWLLAAEYLLLHGTPWVLLCERGIRTFERSLRYTLDVGAIPVVAAQTALPCIADPSHAAGHWRYVTPLALAAIAAGAEGLLVEVHPDPLTAQSDAAQQLTLSQFALLKEKASALAAQPSGRLP